MADTTTELEVLDQIVDVLGGQSGQYETVVPVLRQIKELLAAGITDPEAIAEAVHNELVAHPEWTTTVPDNSLNGAIKLIDGSVPNSKLAQTGGVLDKTRKITFVAGVNIYDAEHNAVVQADPQFTVGTVYLNGYVGDVVISTAGSRATYITNLLVVDADGIDMGVSFGSTIYSQPSMTRQGKVVTIPSGAASMSFKYRTTYSGGDLCKEMMVTKTNSAYAFNRYEPYHETTVLEDSDYATKQNVIDGIVAYVSTSGSDSNDGLTYDTAVATLEKALTIAHTVKMERGIYTDTGVNVSDLDGITIQPYDNDDEYAHANPKRQKIVFRHATMIDASDCTTVDGLVTASLSGGFQYDAVFVSHTVEPVIDANTRRYRANLHVIYSDVSKMVKLKPVLSKALCADEVGTFFWDGTAVWCNLQDTSFASLAAETEGRMIFTNCNDLTMEDVACEFGYSEILKISNSNNVRLINCYSSYCSTGMGFTIINSDVVFDYCYATHNGYDGFNFHGYGTTVLNDCTGEYNWDDGCSHHDGCVGVVNGGRFTGNGKCGIAPAYGAQINIYDAFCDGNVQGIGYLSTDNGHAPMTGIVSSCALVGNAVGLSVNALCSVDAINCKYSGNTTDKAVVGTLREF